MESSVMDGQDNKSATWQSSRVRAATETHAVSQAIAARLTSAMEVEMMAKQLSAGELDRLVKELLSELETTAE